MRLKIELRYEGKLPFDLPLNYNHKLTANIYRLFSKSSKKYSEFLHDKGFIINGKHLKLFTFSRLFPRKYEIKEHYIRILSPEIDWYFSTIIDKSIEHIVKGIFSDECIILNYRDEDIELKFSQIISEAEIEFTEEIYPVSPEISRLTGVKFKCLSPINVNSNKRKKDLDYFNDTDLFREELYNNLKTKYQLIYDKPIQTEIPFNFEFLPEYLFKKENKISDSIQYRTSDGKIIYIKGFFAPFKIVCDPKLIEIGYQCGFGMRNSAGFGMVEKL
ncbi:MAG: CRISPR-associated endoribonuclease Cas6 [Candidatus Cloacimonetes bacterium]|nr:CRISPR-associated endoribonuclease Cas6 [Candidatus Cloacimonadota bacterium]